MTRLIAISIAFLSFSLPVFAQPAFTARVVRTAVVLQQPRGDSPVITTVPPGVVLDVFEQSDEWYSVAVPDGVTASTKPIGWIQRQAVQLLTGLDPAASAAAGQQTATQVYAQSVTGRDLLQPGLFELMLDASFVGATSGGNTESTLRTDAMFGYFATSSLEVGGVATILKLPGLKAVGTLGGMFALNFAGDSLVVPFIGTAAGAGIGFPATTGNPFWMNFFGGFKVLMPGGGGAFVIRPFYERQFYSDSLLIQDINLFGIAVGASILF